MNYEITNSYISEPSSNKNKTNIITLLLLIFSVVFIPAAYVFVAAVFIVQLAKGTINLKLKNKFCILIYAFVAIGLISSEYKLISTIYALIFLLCYFTYQVFSSLNLDTTKKIKNIIFALSIIVFFIGIIQYLNPEFIMPSKWVDLNEYNLRKRIYSTFFNPNVFGFYTNFIILLTCENIDFKKINLEWIAFISGVICLILTFSRTAWISLIISLIIASILNKKYLKYALIISMAVFSLDTLLGIGRIDPLKAVGDSSFLYRIEVWKASIEIIKDNFISGIGFGTLFKHIAQYSSIVSTKIEHGHNLYIQIFTETGILGFSIFVTLLFHTLKTFRYKLYENNNKIWITAFAVFSMTMIHGLVDSVSLTPQILMILSIYAGMIKAMNNEQ